MEYFKIMGGKKLSGEAIVNSSKNAAVAVLLGSLVNRGKTTLKNVPQIEEINRLLEVMESIGVRIEKKGRDLIIEVPVKIKIEKINRQASEKTRSIILMIGALAGRMKKYVIPQAGGCRLGSRTVKPHLFALENFGMDIKTTSVGFEVSSRNLHLAKKIVMYEAGDTATENAILVAAQIPGKTTIKLASANYMVQDLCFFLEKLGVKIAGIGSMTLEIEGLKEIKRDIEYEISEDPIEAMFFISLAASTKSEILIKRCPIEFLDLELLKLSKMGLKYEITKEYLARNGKTKLVDIKTYPSKFLALEEKIHPAAPSSAGINIDNLPFFVPVAMMAKGKTLIHDWVYENRAIYFMELNRLGANVTLLDPHRVFVEGPSKLKGKELISPPALRPAAIMLVAMLASPGESILRGVYSINRGYENLEERLTKLGASIELVKE
jgi:UDP-N-acetylglucosamine 1-carboxyvinyltransferase